MDTIRDMIAAQRAELAEVLTGLPGPSWDRSTLCAGWRVREVVAHVTMPFRFSGRRFALELAKSRGRFNEMADRVARRDAAAMSPADLAGALRSNTGHPWKPPGGGFTGALAHDLIHGLDITVPLGLDRPGPGGRAGGGPAGQPDRPVGEVLRHRPGRHRTARQRHGLDPRLRHATGRYRGRS